MGGFIQTITFSTSRIDEVRALGEAMRDQRTGSSDGPKPVRVVICADRDVPNRYTSVVEFASYEDAMANSSRPETSQFAEQMSKLCDGPPTFVNLDMLDEFQP